MFRLPIVEHNLYGRHTEPGSLISSAGLEMSERFSDFWDQCLFICAITVLLYFTDIKLQFKKCSAAQTLLCDKDLDKINKAVYTVFKPHYWGPPAGVLDSSCWTPSPTITQFDGSEKCSADQQFGITYVTFPSRFFPDIPPVKTGAPHVRCGPRLRLD